MSAKQPERPKRARGRPMTKGYPPRIDATPEELAQAMFRAPPNLPIDTEKLYRCVECGREVNYPETLYRDNRCDGCTETLAR